MVRADRHNKINGYWKNEFPRNVIEFHLFEKLIYN